MLISVHLPKTAGSSFGSALRSHWGNGLVLDYSDRPINQSSVGRNFGALKASLKLFNHNLTNGRCGVHGHFMPLKYRWLRTAERKEFVVWLRDPIERLASHYYYWAREYDPQTAGRLRIRMVEEDWSLERVCFSREMQNIYSKIFWGFPMERFDFVGITENYESDLNYFAANILKSDLSMSELNTNPKKAADRYVEDESLRSSLEKFHRRDMQLYWKALSDSNKRNKLLSNQPRF